MSAAAEPAGTLEVALDHATRLLRKNATLAAEQALEILKAVPRHPHARLILGAARRRLAQDEAALAVLEPLAREQPDSTPVHLELGMARGQAGDAAAAVSALRRAASLSPRSPDAWRLLADQLDVLGDAAAADEARARYLAAANNDPRLREAAAALVDNDLPKADARLRAHLRMHTTDVAALRMLAEVAARLRRYADAQQLLERCLELAPSFDAARHNYATVLSRQSKAAAALAQIERLLAKEPANPSYRNLQAAALAQIGDYAHTIADYSDYSEFYDRIFGSGAVWTNGATLGAGTPVMPQELVVTKGYFEKWSHELRLTTPQELPVQGTAGVFIQRQQHDIWEQYVMPGYGFTNPYGSLDSPTPNPNGFGATIPGTANTIWLTDEQRVDRDKAVFFQGTWDITSKWALNGGLRYFKYDNSLEGFYGYSANYFGSPGQSDCFNAGVGTAYSPCTNLDKSVSDSGKVPRVNLTYKFTPDKLVYATYSKGFRPGGVNRTEVAGIGPYQADFLTNYEIGWKTQWFDNKLRWNAAAFWEDWKNFQFSFLGPNSLTIIENGGNARIKGFENEVEFAATSALTLSTNFTFLDPRLTQNICGQVGVTVCPGINPNVSHGGPQPFTGTPWVGPEAPAGTNLPVTPKFKANVVARYSFDEIVGWKPFVQASGTSIKLRRRRCCW